MVTGGTSGIGKATALAFANAGAKVVLTGRREKEGIEVVAEIKKRGGTASFFKADFAEDSDVRAAVDFVLTTYGRLDIAFNNAGVEARATLDEVTGSGAIPDKWMFVWQNDFLGSMPPRSPPRALERSLLFWSAV